MAIIPAFLGALGTTGKAVVVATVVAGGGAGVAMAATVADTTTTDATTAKAPAEAQLCQLVPHDCVSLNTSPNEA